MRIWHKELIPKLCRQHLLGVWREALGAYTVITEDKQGYANHPQVQMYADAPEELHAMLALIRKEMLARGYNPKELPEKPETKGGEVDEWQTLEEQITVLRQKECACDI